MVMAVPFMLCIVTQNRQFFHKCFIIPDTNKSLPSMICFCSTDTLVSMGTSAMPSWYDHSHVMNWINSHLRDLLGPLILCCLGNPSYPTRSWILSFMHAFIQTRMFPFANSFWWLTLSTSWILKIVLASRCLETHKKEQTLVVPTTVHFSRWGNRATNHGSFEDTLLMLPEHFRPLLLYWMTRKRFCFVFVPGYLECVK